MTTRKRRADETPAELSQSIRKLVRWPYPDSGLEFQEEIAIKQVKNNFELKQALFRGKPKTLDEATEIVTEAEDWLKAERASHSRVVKAAENDTLSSS